MNDDDHFIRKSLQCSRVARQPTAEAISVQQYYSDFYSDIVEQMEIPHLPLIICNTINKRICLSITSKGYYLIFDNYIIELFYQLNNLVLVDTPQVCIESFCYKMMAESCRLKSWYIPAINFAGEYMNRIEGLMLASKNIENDNRTKNYLFIQQDFLIAHELFHYIINRKPSLYNRSQSSKRNYFDKIIKYANLQGTTTTAEGIRHAVDNSMLEECFCDATALIHAVDIGNKLKKSSTVDCAIACTLALLHQFELSIISEIVNNAGNHEPINLSNRLNRLNVRLLHFKCIACDYIREADEKLQVDDFSTIIEELTDVWNKKVATATLDLLSKEVLQADLDTSIMISREHRTKFRNVLSEVFNT